MAACERADGIWFTLAWQSILWLDQFMEHSVAMRIADLGGCCSPLTACKSRRRLPSWKSRSCRLYVTLLHTIGNDRH